MNNLKWIKTFLLLLVCFILQTTVVDWLQIFGIGPDLMIILIVSISIKYGPAAGCFWGFFAGFSQDIYAPVEWLGANTISMTVLGFVVGQLEERFLTLNLPAKVAVLAIGFFVCDMLYFMLTGLEKDVVTNLFFSKTIPECIYTVVVGAVVFYLSSGKKKRNV
ncbi:MAG: rod shape-determining protein MreD [Fibrobacter sp.]|jgi:rod shape-determining protein MreD|uniref:rod shape-determining protein MreD n=1 Tax=Fibrobacter sp. UWP2 TaxID=1896216 RepID=UPI00091106A0|nr:rod shape-determining protein MreD [Fibrobacter sp. UWP2]MBO7383058.1 rod shape-determining protein MreD [Fibrobacter sp.]SHI66667.1 rod shape-determining protein MreD [Fibrobacter sp. UWP2]